MTPMVRAVELREALRGLTWHVHDEDALDTIIAAIRAAIAEIDAEWGRAFDSYVLQGTESMCRHCSGLLRDALDPRSCEHCAPLRALLSEAARSANQESPKNPPERTE